MLLDEPLLVGMVDKEVAQNAELFIWDREVTRRNVAASRSNAGSEFVICAAIMFFRAFGPEEHASNRMQDLSALRRRATLLLALLATTTPEVSAHSTWSHE